MTTTVLARRLTVDHHGLHARFTMPDGTKVAGTLTDTLIGPENVDVWLNGGRLTINGGRFVELTAIPGGST